MILLVTGTNGETAPDHPFQEAMLVFARQHGLPAINMIDIWKSMNQDKVFLDYGHPRPEGHEMIAQQLFAAIRGLDHYCSAEPSTSAGTVSASSLPHLSRSVRADVPDNQLAQ
jgi:hypothetical protein